MYLCLVRSLGLYLASLPLRLALTKPDAAHFLASAAASLSSAQDFRIDVKIARPRIFSIYSFGKSLHIGTSWQLPHIGFKSLFIQGCQLNKNFASTELIIENIYEHDVILQESKREDRKKLADEDAMRKIRQLEDQAYQLQKQLATHKQVRCLQILRFTYLLFLIPLGYVLAWIFFFIGPSRCL